MTAGPKELPNEPAEDLELPRVIEGLKNADGRVRTAAVRTLGQVGTNSQTAAVRELLQAQTTLPHARHAALSVLGASQAVLDVQVLAGCLGDPAPCVRAAAIEIMKKFAFFDIEQGVVNTLVDKLHGGEHEGVNIQLEVSTDKPTPLPTKNKKFSKQKEYGMTQSGRRGARSKKTGVSPRRSRKK